MSGAPSDAAQDVSVRTRADDPTEAMPLIGFDHVAVAASPAVAAGLDLVAGAPCLRLDRRTWSAERGSRP